MSLAEIGEEEPVLPVRSRAGLFSRARWLVIPVALGTLTAVGVGGVGIYWCGSLRSFIAYLDGCPVVPEAFWKDLGEVSPDEPAAASFVLRNLTSEPVTVTGMEASCGCIVPDNLPLTIDPYGREELALRVRPTSQHFGKKYKYRETVIIFIDKPSPRIALSMIANVVGKHRSPE